ncbi:NAD-dependent epimerase/dehydratase family protein [Granulicella arctica]|uniref:NAD-dependent epimerase/dehydratase family protein n=1 Tax=Granulicella arctica TaxID=940613 RepID=UPI0021DFC8DC|nr:NAD-dependent epimerase/dehydratase family protein [Granulicella arctica]
MPPLDPRDLEEIVSLTEPLWEEVRGQRIFLTGGTGFFGCWLIESFLRANQKFSLNAEMVVLTRSWPNFLLRCPHLANNPALAAVEGDVRSFPFPEGEFAFVLHAAADTGDVRTGNTTNGALSTLSTIFEGTHRTLEFAATHGTRKFLMVSSGAVYGAQPTSITHLPEDYRGAPDPCQAASAYGEAKRAAEALCAAYAGSSSLVPKIARCFAFVGPHLPLQGSYAIGNFIRSAIASQTIRISGDGTPLRSYLYATDLAVWLWTILFKAPALQPINIGSHQALSIGDLAREVQAALNPELTIEVVGRPLPDVLPSRYVPSTQRAFDELGLRQTVELRDAIQRTAAWHGWARDQEHHL